MKKREKILLGTTALLGTALGISLHQVSKQKKKMTSIEDNCKQLTAIIQDQEVELLQKRGNMHFVKNCLSIIKSFAEEAEESEDIKEYLDSVSKANRNTIKSLDLVSPLLEHLTYATNHSSSTLFVELKHLKVFREFINIRSDNRYEIRYHLDDNVKPYLKHKICCCVFTEILENAYKHSYITHNDNIIDVDIRIADDDYLIYTVSNPIYISKRAKRTDRVGGMGLKNIRERLAMFYQNGFEISCQELNGRYEFKLIVKLKKGSINV